MANQEHLDILKQGVEVWNQWRQEHLEEIQPDLSFANLSRATLIEANLSNANLIQANLSRVNLTDASLREAMLTRTKLRGANLNGANLVAANLWGANLNGANLVAANLTDASLRGAILKRALLMFANLSSANFCDADLTGVFLNRANLSQANLSGADLSGASVQYTLFTEVDLSMVKGLEMVRHEGPSTIGIDTIINSQGKIPESFLRGAGVPPSIIEQIPALVGSLKPIDFYSCFISYSSKDQDFANRLYADLQAARVRCWFAPHDLKTGDRYRDRIEESIRMYDKLLLILSENAVNSTWVEEEVEKAMDKERQLRAQGRKQTVLFPIKLDDTAMQTTKAWAADVRRMWHIGDFIGWHDYACYQRAFTRLLRDLKSEA